MIKGVIIKIVLDKLRQKVEQQYGLPKLESVVGLTTGESGKRLNTLLGRLERLSKDKQSLEVAAQLLQKVEGMNSSGSLDKLLELTKELNSLAKGRQGQKLLERLDKLESLVDRFLKE